MLARATIVFTLVFSLLGFTIPINAQGTDTLTTLDYEIEMEGGWTAAAKLTMPATADNPPLVILFHGSGPFDMNATYAVNQESSISENFLTIAETLAQNGIAVLRFNKRGVIGFGDYDFAQLQESRHDVLISDANAAIDFVLTQDIVDPEHIYLYGWSEGAWVIANVAAMRDDIAGLIMQGTPSGDIDEVLSYQYLELAPQYLIDEVDIDGDGLLSVIDVADIPLGPVQSMIPFFFYEQGSDPTNPTINSFVDRNSDERISIEDELIPTVEMYLQNLEAFQSEQDVSYDIAQLLTEASIPTLLLHGENDGWTPLSGAQQIVESTANIVTLKTYADLGHALSMVPSPAEDGFFPMELKPLSDAVVWLQSGQ